MKTEEKQNNYHILLKYVNALFQLITILSFQQFGIIWPFYIVMVLIGVVITVQTLAAAIAFSGIARKDKAAITFNTSGINVLISLLYLVSSYYIYLIGFVGFAWIGAAHSVINLLTNILGANTNDSSSVSTDEK